MMMAQDSGSFHPMVLDENVVRVVRDALGCYLQTPEGDPAELRAALHALAAEARRLRMPPEQLLVHLKGIWYALPAVRDAHSPAEQVRLLQRAVSMCIGEYFAE